MTRAHYILATLVALILVGGPFLYMQFAPGDAGGVAPLIPGMLVPRVEGTLGAGSAQSAPPLTNEYRSEKYRFLFLMPEGYVAGQFPSDDGVGEVIVAQNEAGDGIQIIVTPFGEDLKILTVDRIKEDIPDMAMTDVQNVAIGDTYKGVTFRSDNELFGGSSREVWFVYLGNLYQISTYTRLDPLLRAIFATWKFF